MKITELRAQNVKRLTAVEIKPDGSLIVVGGKNGAGKSSVLDSIVYALAGGRDLPSKPVRNGEKSAEIEVRIDSEPPMIVRRKFNEDGKSTLQIRQVNENGHSTLSSPQKLLDTLCGTIAFDPLAFTRLRPQEQVNMLRKIVGVDVSDLDSEIQSLFEERTQINRDAKSLKNQVDACNFHPLALEEEVSSKDILAKIESANEHNQHIERLERVSTVEKSNVGYAEQEVTDAKQKVIELEEALEEAKQNQVSAEKALKEVRGRAEKADKELQAAERIDTAPFKAELETLEDTNQKIRENKRRNELEAQHRKKLDEAEGLSVDIETLRKQRIDRLSKAKWPVKGLAFSDNGITYNDLPFEQCSSAEQLRISTAIGFSQQPKLNVALIHDGSLLDEENLAAIAAEAEKHNGQIWIERVGKGAECSVVIATSVSSGVARVFTS